MEENTGKRMEKKKNEDSLRDIWDNVKYTNSHIIGVPEEDKNEPEKIFKEIIVENFLNTGKEIVTQVHEVKSPLQDKPKEEYNESHINQAKKK